MVCIRCGSQVEPVDNFCRSCGARLRQSAGASAADESSRTERAQGIPSAARSPRSKRIASGASGNATPAPAQERNRMDATSIFLGVLFLIAVAAGSVYLAAHLFRQTGQRDRPLVADAPASLSRDEINRRGDAADNTSTSLAQQWSPQQSPSAPLDSFDQSPSVVSKPRPNTEASELSTRKPPVQTNERQSTGIASSKIPPSAPTSRRASAAGAYETRDSTPLFEQPSASSPVVANIPAGTRVEVVNSKGEWLEVHSRRGNPPGFIRRQDAKFLEKTD